ncbi:MAG TPA: amino acid adenylation domain-containing protein, partial [Thermoanaerobaculia bacterium]|nr:amino acid adenylation domain-containing protein [Thermoanaerobaculia bacterium]
MSRWTGRDDLVVGSPMASRNRLETEDLIGFFVNTLPLRGNLAGDPGFGALLERVHKATVEAYAHEDLPFEKLVEELQPERSLSHFPIFQVVLVLQNAPVGALEMPGLNLEPQAAESGTTKFDLTVSVNESPGVLYGFWEYDSDLFDAPTIRRFQEHFTTLLSAALAAPERRLADLPLLTAAERDQLLAWNRAQAGAPVALCLHELFALQAGRRPGAVAVSCEGRDMTYGELDELSARLAASLAAQGVGPEVPVALCLERGPLLVAAILAVLRAGGAYVPIDPAYPRERQAWILEDSGARLLLTERSLAAGLPASGVPLLCLDVLAGELPVVPGAGPAVPALPQGLAYVIYTSGSTGRPKGVPVQHDHVLRLFERTQAWFGFGEDDIWTLFHSYAFDFSVWEIWGALLHGGRLVVVPHEVSRSPKDFHALLVRERVTVLNQTPSAFRQLITADAAEGAEAGGLSLRFVVFGGEALELQSLRPWIDRHGDQEPRLINMYGITETTVHVTWRPILAADLESAGSPVGVAIPDLDLRVLDRSLALLPVGVPGELCVGGAGLARGYLGRPELTAERFVPDPFGTAPGARLYRSGDLVRYRSDGDLEHLGRIDHQVKIRGFRIELGEIEAALCRHPAVAQAVVAAFGEGESRVLVAWVVPTPGNDPETGPEPAELREHLRSRLPDYMLPASWMPLPSLPLTPSGKVDRKALPRPDRAAAVSYEAPRSDLEHRLAEIWQDLLGLDRVGVHDNFFDLGGHSLLMARVQSRITEELGREISMVDLLSHASVDGLARLLAREGPAGL